MSRGVWSGEDAEGGPQDTTADCGSGRVVRLHVWRAGSGVAARGEFTTRGVTSGHGWGLHDTGRARGVFSGRGEFTAWAGEFRARGVNM
eukprot:6030614-Pyramimonas_sp.AAC.1